MRIVPGSTDYQQHGISLAKGATAEFDRIRADNRLSPKGKVGQMAALWLTTKEQLRELSRQESDARSQRRHELERAIFGLKGVADPASAISYRDAQDRVANVNLRDDALALLGRAERSGDEVLARAIGQRAVEQGWRDVLETFAESRPQVVEALTELAQLNPDPMVWRLSSEMSYDLPVPAELYGMSENTMRGEAAQEERASEQRTAAVTPNPPLLAG